MSEIMFFCFFHSQAELCQNFKQSKSLIGSQNLITTRFNHFKPANIINYNFKTFDFFILQTQNSSWRPGKTSPKYFETAEK